MELTRVLEVALGVVLGLVLWSSLGRLRDWFLYGFPIFPPTFGRGADPNDGATEPHAWGLLWLAALLALVASWFAWGQFWGS